LFIEEHAIYDDEIKITKALHSLRQRPNKGGRNTEYSYVFYNIIFIPIIASKFEASRAKDWEISCEAE
jgi:hypothetical protein